MALIITPVERIAKIVSAVLHPLALRGLSTNGTKNREKDRSVVSNLVHIMIPAYPITQNLKLV
jgi:hypothetical protein